MEFGMRRLRRSVIAGACIVPWGIPGVAQSITLSTLGSPVAEDFNSLVSTGTGTSLPSGWSYMENGLPGIAYTAGNGSGNAGDTYSFGVNAVPERALGSLNSGSTTPIFGAQFQNDTGSTLSSLLIAYTGEQWRLGDRNGAVGVTDRLDFQISRDASDLVSGTWTDVDALDFNAPNTSTGVAAVLDGNASANRTGLSHTITGLSIAQGDVFWIRWNSFDATPGADDGLAIDDFSLTPFAATTGGGGGENGGGGTGIPEPASLALFGIGVLGLAALRRKSGPGVATFARR